jgi:hypothetical protein
MIKDVLKFGAKKVFPVENVEETTKILRYGICKICDKYNAEDDKCTVCGCFMEIKTGTKIHRNPLKLRTEVTHCPLGKWADKEIANHYRRIDNKPLI